MVENMQNLAGPAPTQPANLGTLANPVVTALLRMAETITLLNDLDLGLAAEVESKRREIVIALLRDHEALAGLSNAWERAVAKKPAGEGN